MKVVEKVFPLGNKQQLESLNKKLDISISFHHSSNVAVVAHHDCGGNPVSKEEHLKQLAEAVDLLTSRRLPVRISGLWVDECWQVQLVHDKPRRQRCPHLMVCMQAITCP